MYFGLRFVYFFCIVPHTNSVQIYKHTWATFIGIAFALTTVHTEENDATVDNKLTYPVDTTRHDITLDSQ